MNYYIDVSSLTHDSRVVFFQETVGGTEKSWYCRLVTASARKDDPLPSYTLVITIEVTQFWQNLLLYLNVMSTKYKHDSYLTFIRCRKMTSQ